MENRETEVVILVCRLGGGFSFGCDDEFVVDRCNHRRIRCGVRCSEAIERLLDAGFKLVSTESVDCKIVYTFVKSNHSRPRRGSDEY